MFPKLQIFSSDRRFDGTNEASTKHPPLNRVSHSPANTAQKTTELVLTSQEIANNFNVSQSFHKIFVSGAIGPGQAMPGQIRRTDVSVFIQVHWVFEKWFEQRKMLKPDYRWGRSSQMNK